MFRKKKSESLEDIFFASLSDAIEKSGREFATSEISAFVEGALEEVLTSLTPKIVTSLERSAPRMLREHRRIERDFRRRLRNYWGSALDAFYAIWVCTEETGDKILTRCGNAEDASGLDHDILLALTGLHAQCCRVAFEVHSLLTAGLPKGALARCRTMHELAVTALVLEEYARREEHPDLVKGFLYHHHVTSYQDALQYQKNSRRLNAEPFSDDELAELRAMRDEAVRCFGSRYLEPYGWANGLVSTGKRVTFDDLERLAEISHLRPYYKMASHEVHSSSKSLVLNVTERGADSFLTIGPVNFGLSDPGQTALIYLLQCNAALATSTNPGPDIETLLALRAIQTLTDEALALFAEAEQQVEDDEARYQADEVGAPTQFIDVELACANRFSTE